ncbi:LacI family transcriptional regulator [Paenibacillus sp. TRM 82003]|uniref:LacI family DNA-binding transcriptional regulator n=1 Tax=Kineococcus sp. TRM81007 TaxID=2925831 RepID=UPI001F58C1DB|nr:LacI family DNA-binding transcriptional regulator [Kineococcus sp. TRM81007]MCI2238611.1 LacI family transcriptional regulator [Kineococcus sp. TRM81007]MCI3927273.1 LacI family transcriptional regulator [Paenibacillus sp. TRM 82003]
MSRPSPGAARPTIRDIARVAGVSKASVSYALNDLPGVSAATRERVLLAARELGWRPSAAARSLSHARAHAVGLAVARDVELLGEEPYYMRLVAGMEGVLATESVSLLMTVVPDADTAVDVLRRWWAERRVDGVVLTDLLVEDPRLALVTELGVPSVVRGGREEEEPGGGAGTVAVSVEEEREPFERVVEHLLLRGHRRLARVSGPPEYRHTRRRDRAWQEVTTAALGAEQEVVVADYSARGGLEATRALLARPRPPTAVLYDNDVMAATVVAERRSLGVAVPADLAVVAGEDSILCRLADPGITALRRDVVADGAATARLLLDLLAGRAPRPLLLAPRELVVRGSSGSVLTPRAGG